MADCLIIYVYCGIPAVSISALIDYVRWWNNHGDASGSLVIYRVGWEKMFFSYFLKDCLAELYYTIRANWSSPLWSR